MPNSYSNMLRPAMTRTTAMAVKTMMVQHQSGSCTVHRPAPRPRPWPIASRLLQSNQPSKIGGSGALELELKLSLLCEN